MKTLRYILGTQLIFKIIIIHIAIFMFFDTQGQTGISEDITHKFLTTKEGKAYEIVTDFGQLKYLGTFIKKTDQFEELRICNSSDFNVWINGRFFFKSSNCIDIDKETLFNLDDSDTIFISLSTKNTFTGLRASLTRSDLLSVIASYPKIERRTKKFKDLMIIAAFIFLLFYGFMKFFFPKSITIKANLNFLVKSRIKLDIPMAEFSIELILESLFLSILIGFTYLYFVGFNVIEKDNMSYILLQWIRYSAAIFIFLILKFIIIYIVARLNEFKGLVYIQYNEFLKLFTLAAVLLCLIIMGNFWFKYFINSPLNEFWNYYYLIVYATFLVYYFLKMSSSLPVKKLHIISYLCSTEILGIYFVAIIFIR